MAAIGPWVAQLREAPAQLLRRLRQGLQGSDTVGPLALAVAVGLLAAAGAVVLRYMIRAVQWIFFDQGTRLDLLTGLPIPPWLVTVLAPAAGFLLVTWIVRRVAPEAAGHGVPEVQFSVRMRGGRIRPRVALAKAVTASISIGSGGSVGREGPIVQIGSTLGSAVAQFVGMGAQEMRILVAAGAAGAIGATFNAPIAGVLFALEVILGSFAARSFGLVVVASVTATAAAQTVLGTEPAFRLVEEFRLVSNWELALYPLLGLAAGLIALLYVRSVYGVEAWFNRWSAPVWSKALAGGLLVGLLGTFGSPHLFGVGHEGVELAMAGELSITLMAALVLMKIAATSVTLGAGGSGGVFAPALFIGAMAGGAFGKAADGLLPTLAGTPGAYALVGAAAVFGAAAHAPLTATIILFEMTDNYRIILPLMLAVVLAQLVASRIDPDSIYSIKLRRRGGADGPREPGTLDFVLVDDAMSEEIPSVPPELPLTELAEMAREGPDRSWVVLDAGERPAGIISVTDLERAILEGELGDRTVGDVMTQGLVTTRPGESLRQAFQRFAERDVYQIPVVDTEEDGRVVGMLRRTEMMWAYKELADEHARLLARTDALPAHARFESVNVEVQVEIRHRRICHRAIRDIHVPEHALIALLRRGERVVVPRGFTRVEPGDVLTLITTREHERELRDWLQGR
ncbi:MAG: chloride channel protein [Gemmatimonadales bacterium]|nr:MAG: chloride channel protein [Gemmatimonadales bacterium]